MTRWSQKKAVRRLKIAVCMFCMSFAAYVSVFAVVHALGGRECGNLAPPEITAQAVTPLVLKTVELPKKTVVKKKADTIKKADKEQTSKAAAKKTPKAAKKEKPKGKTIDLYNVCRGDVFTYMGWQLVTAKGTDAYRFRIKNEQYDELGFGRVDGRYVVATTSTFGDVGDKVDFTLKNGEVIHAVIGDHKNQRDAGCNMYGHDMGRCVVEFVVDKYSWYGTKKTVKNQLGVNSRVIAAYIYNETR